MRRVYSQASTDDNDIAMDALISMMNCDLRAASSQNPARERISGLHMDPDHDDKMGGGREF